MKTAFGILTSAGLLLIMLSDYGTIAAIPSNKPSARGSDKNQHVGQPVNQHVEKPKCDLYGWTIECYMPALDGNIGLTNYTGNIVWLNLFCDAKANLPSRLVDGFFEPLGRTLKYVFIYNCNFITISKGAFRGLQILESFRIEGRRCSQLGRIGLEILNGTYSSPNTKTVLYLPSATTACSHGNLVLPDGIFSDLEHLDILHLNTMRLNDSVWQVVKSLSNIKNLELRKNNITSIDISAINKQQMLYGLSLNENYIEVIQNGSFESLSLLQHLSLSKNRIRVLEKDAFKGLSHLLNLRLSENCIHTLNKGTFNGLTDLRLLSLTGNKISTIEINTFESLTELYTLALSGNSIHTLNKGIFNGLTNLRELYLTGNNASTIEINTFANMTELEILKLIENSIHTLQNNTFKGLAGLRTLDLSENSIHTLKMEIFKGLSGLQRLYLTGNNVRTIEINTFASLPDLDTLDLSGNCIDTLKMDTFKGLTGLETLNLSRNSIHSPDVDIFKDMSKLRILDLSGNSISTLETDMFTGLRNIRLIFLAENHIKTIALDALSGLTTLRKLDLSNNHINSFPILPSSLNFLWLSNNDIVEIDTTSFARLTNLSMLDLSHNTIRELEHYTIPNTTEKFNISSNNISVASFYLPPNLTYADFRNNQIKSLKVSGLQKYRDRDGSDAIYLAENGNPFHCVCNLEVFNNESGLIYDGSNVSQYHIWDFSSINCSSKTIYESREIIEIPLPDFSCKYHTTCPENCTCYLWKYTENINIVDCQNAGMTIFPVNISASCSILDLSGNIFQFLVPKYFDGLSQLTELYLNASNITEVKEGTFRNLVYLAKLDLGHNNISSLDSGIFTGLTRLSCLDLSFNSIHVVMESTFESLTRLKYLDLARNELETISNFDIESMHTLKSLYLSNNPWSCNCTFLERFIPLTLKDSVQDQGDIICFTSNNTKYQLIKIDLPDFCPDSDSDSKQSKPMSTAEIALTAGFSVFVIGTISFCILLKNKNFIKLLCFIKCGWRPGKNEMDRYYDAFVSFNKDDTGFIVRELMPRLEAPRQDRPAYKLCIHFRDFPVGSCIANTILAAVRHSKRVIIILSDNFLKSEWCHYEFHAAYQQVIDEKTNRIIMVLLQDINTDLLDAKLKSFLRTRTYVKYGDPRFWDKIEHVMPKQKKQGDGNLNVDNIDDVPADNMQDDAPLLR